MREEIIKEFRNGTSIEQIQRWFGISNTEAFHYYCEYLAEEGLN